MSSGLELFTGMKYLSSALLTIYLIEMLEVDGSKAFMIVKNKGISCLGASIAGALLVLGKP